MAVDKSKHDSADVLARVERRETFGARGYVGMPTASGLYIVFYGDPSCLIAVHDPEFGWFSTNSLLGPTSRLHVHLGGRFCVGEDLRSIHAAGSASEFIVRAVKKRLLQSTS